jgi:hypothetical protein
MKISRSAARIGDLFGRVQGALPAVHGLALSGLVALAGWAPMAQAVVVVSPAANLAVPLTTQGIYINVVSGVSNVAPGSAPGWDINPWGSATSTSALNFFNATLPAGTLPASGSYVVSIAGQTANLAPGTVIGAATPLFGSGQATTTAATSPWVLNATNYFGFRFGGDDGLLHYGYGTMIVGATLQTRTVGSLYYEDVAGAAITVSAVPELSTGTMLLAGAALGGFALRRKRLAS